MPVLTNEAELYVMRDYAAPPARVWAAFTNPAEVARWWGPDGFTCPHCEWDPKPGGKYRTCMQSPNGVQNWLSGEFRLVDPPRRLAFTWAWEPGGARGHESLVVVSIRPEGLGTRVTIVHSMLESPESRARHEQGWTSTLVSLDRFLASGG
ncbi:MAG: SRPBCC domain-containing protein [Alphaproteobacteria bacterium]|nr:SRPBCC domain-containing protein [Alphaproteobacteria bacterium]